MFPSETSITAISFKGSILRKSNTRGFAEGIQADEADIKPGSHEMISPGSRDSVFLLFVFSLLTLPVLVLSSYSTLIGTSAVSTTQLSLRQHGRPQQHQHLSVFFIAASQKTGDIEAYSLDYGQTSTNPYPQPQLTLIAAPFNKPP